MHSSNRELPMSQMGHSRPGPAGRRSSHVRYAPKATVGHQNAIGRDGPLGDIHFEVMPLVVSRAVWSVDAIGRTNWNRAPLLQSDNAVS